MAKFRSKNNFAQLYNCDKQGYNLGLDGFIYLKRETTARVFAPMSVGTQGSSIGAVSASTDISAHASPATLQAAVHGAAPVTASLATAGLNTGTLIAAALETAINTALAAASLDHRVWVNFDAAGPDQYEVYDQSTGTASAVVITAGVTNDISLELKLGVSNSGTEAAGTADTDFLLYTTGGITFAQPVESNAHRAGRYHTGIIRQKKVVEFDFDTYINMSGSAGASIDDAVALLIENALGSKTVNSGVSIDFAQGHTCDYMSAAKVSTIFGEYYTGLYVQNWNLEFPGDGPATMKFTGRGADCQIAGLAQVNGAVSASTSVVLNAGESRRYSVGSRVMVVDPDGRTILHGYDGSLTVNAIVDSTHTLTLSAAVTVADNGFVVPWDPGAAGQTARDAVFTDLVGHFKADQQGSNVDVTNISLAFENNHVDFDNRFGSDTNKGRAAANRLTGNLSVTFDLSNETMGDVVRARDFGGFDPEIVLGSTSSGRYLRIRAPKWIPAVPTLDIPENGTTEVTLEGTLYQSAPGQKDPFSVSFR